MTVRNDGRHTSKWPARDRKTVCGRLRTSWRVPMLLLMSHHCTPNTTFNSLQPCPACSVSTLTIVAPGELVDEACNQDISYIHTCIHVCLYVNVHTVRVYSCPGIMLYSFERFTPAAFYEFCLWGKPFNWIQKARPDSRWWCRNYPKYRRWWQWMKRRLVRTIYAVHHHDVHMDILVN